MPLTVVRGPAQGQQRVSDERMTLLCCLLPDLVSPLLASSLLPHAFSNRLDTLNQVVLLQDEEILVPGRDVKGPLVKWILERIFGLAISMHKEEKAPINIINRLKPGAFREAAQASEGGPISMLGRVHRPVRMDCEDALRGEPKVPRGLVQRHVAPPQLKPLSIGPGHASAWPAPPRSTLARARRSHEVSRPPAGHAPGCALASAPNTNCWTQGRAMVGAAVPEATIDEHSDLRVRGILTVVAIPCELVALLDSHSLSAIPRLPPCRPAGSLLAGLQKRRSYVLSLALGEATSLPVRVCGQGSGSGFR